MDEDADKTSQIHLISSDGVIVIVPRDSVRICKFIEDIISSTYDDESCEEVKQIPFENISTDTLTLLVEFLDHHRIDPINKIRKPLPSNQKLNRIVQPWYYTFVSTREEKLVDLLKASDFLACTPLYELICAFIGSMIRDQPIDKKCEFFGIS